MLTEWRKFAGWKVLESFLNAPYTPVYIRELSRLLKISPRTAQVYCKLYEKDKILKSEKKANAKLFFLNNDVQLVKSLKKMNVLMKLNEVRFVEHVIKKNPRIISMALYGSYASGEYDGLSDFDILVLSDEKIDRRPFVKLQNVLRKRMQLTSFSLSDWISMKNIKDSFALSVLSNNLVLWGAEL